MTCPKVSQPKVVMPPWLLLPKCTHTRMLSEPGFAHFLVPPAYVLQQVFPILQSLACSEAVPGPQHLRTLPPSIFPIGIIAMKTISTP